MGAKLAIDAVLLIRTAGNYNTPTWTELDLARDVQADPTWDKADAFTRQSKVKAYAKTLLELGFTAAVKVDSSDNTYGTVLDAFYDSDTVLDVLMLDGPADTNGSDGYRFDAHVVKASQDQSIGNVLYRDFEFCPAAFATNAPKRALVANNAPVFTAIS